MEVLLESSAKGSRRGKRIEKQRIMGRERKRMERLRQGSEDLRAGRGHCGTDERGGGIYGGGTCHDSCDGASQRSGGEAGCSASEVQGSQNMLEVIR